MWSQPNLTAINREAKRNRKELLRRIEDFHAGREVEHCEVCGRKAAQVLPYYDIFSDDPKGIIRFCERHEDEVMEGYFFCDGCGRVVVTNYTWELYHTQVGDRTLCLPCAVEEELEQAENWLPLTDEAIAALDFEQLRNAPHLIGVDMPVPKTIRHVGNAEFDSMSGQGISGGGVEGLRSILKRLQKQGYSRAILILDAGYQFAVSIGVYVDAKTERRLQKREARLHHRTPQTV